MAPVPVDHRNSVPSQQLKQRRNQPRQQSNHQQQQDRHHYCHDLKTKHPGMVKLKP